MQSDVNPRPEVIALQPDSHGGFDYGELARLGLSPDQLIDFSVNSNPFGPPPGIGELWGQVQVSRYPDRECLALRSALAGCQDCALEQLWVGNGTAELIWLLALAFLRPGDPVLVVTPTFGEYACASALMGARVETLTARPEDNFYPNLDLLLEKLNTLCPRLTFLCNPNNPTGVYLEQRVVTSLLEANPAGLLVLDEAYVSFAPDAWSSTALLDSGRLVVLRSMTKDYALAGLRLGYLLAAADIVAAVARVQPPWSVNAFAQAAGQLVLEQAGFLPAMQLRTAAAKFELTAGLLALGARLRPSTTHFFLVEVENAAQMRTALIHRGILVRDCASFGLPAFVRISTGRPEANRRLLSAWRDILGYDTGKDL